MKEYIIRTDLDIKTCQDCPLVIRHKNGSTACPIKKGSERKYGTCPLKELPEHGRLIDVDKLIKNAKLSRITPQITSSEDLIEFLELYAILDKFDRTIILEANKE